MRKYCNLICNNLDLDIDKNVYATSLCKCVFKEKPAYKNGMLEKHSEKWLPLLKDELSIFSEKVIFITLGEPLLKQLIVSGKNKVKDYWGYIGNTQSNNNFKFVKPQDNHLQKRLYPLCHQPTYKQNPFYKKYFDAYMNFIKQNR